MRAAAVVFAVIVMAGELYRSWGERDMIFWLDDFLVSAGLIAAAWLLGKDTQRRRALFVGAWGFAAGVIYISFFDKVIGAAVVGPGADFSPLNIFVSLSLAAAIAGFIASVRLQPDATH
jgi:hypothetical protein